MRCHQCGSSDVDVDPSRSDVVCMECGAVLSDVSIVSEVNFSEQPSGLSSVVGQFVSLSGSRGLSSSAKRGVGVGGVSSAGYGRDSREQTLSVGRKLLQQLSDALRLRPIHVDQAYGHLKLAVQHNFIQGRRTRYVAAACMYVACRKSKTAHLLLDLADALQVNLYMLGATLLKLIRVLHISLPIVDPSLYIHRFAAQLQLQPNQPLPHSASHSHSQQKDVARGASTHMVAMTALRLVSRMKRDWLQVGRRPSGICGACLLIACRMHGYRRSHREILDVVRICDATLRRRLIEFVATPSSQLTFVEFEQHNAPDEGVEPTAVVDDGHNPPAFTRSIQSEQEADRAAQRKQEVAAQLAAKGIVDADIERQWEREVSQLLQLPAFAQLDDKQAVTVDADLSLRHLINEHCRSRDKSTYESGALKADSGSTELAIAVNADGCVDVDTVRHILANQRAAALRADRTAADVKPNVNDNSGSHGSATHHAAQQQQQQTAMSDLSHLDDAELDEYILTEDEIAFRTAMWDDTHADYIKAQHDRRQQMEGNNGSRHDDMDTAAHSNATDRGREGRGTSAAGGGGGGGGQSQSSSARKKAKLGQSAFFVNATSVQPAVTASQHSDAKPQHEAATAGGSNLTSDVSAMLIASSIASSAMQLSIRQAAVPRQQQRRVSGKLNYERLKGLLDQTSIGDAATEPHQHTVTQRNSSRTDTQTHTADERRVGAKRRRALNAGIQPDERTVRDGRNAEAANDGGDEEWNRFEREEDERDEQDANELAASSMRAEQAEGEHGGLNERDS